MNNTIAKQFTEEWIRAWNSHDLESILAHYAEELSFSSPLIPLLRFNDSGIIQNKSDLKRYFEIGLSAYPELHFKLHHYYIGIQTLVICYTSVNGREAAEVFELNTEGKATKVYCNYSS